MNDVRDNARDMRDGWRDFWAQRPSAKTFHISLVLAGASVLFFTIFGSGAFGSIQVYPNHLAKTNCMLIDLKTYQKECNSCPKGVRVCMCDRQFQNWTYTQGKKTYWSAYDSYRIQDELVLNMTVTCYYDYTNLYDPVRFNDHKGKMRTYGTQYVFWILLWAYGIYVVAAVYYLVFTLFYGIVTCRWLWNA